MKGAKSISLDLHTKDLDPNNQYKIMISLWCHSLGLRCSVITRCSVNVVTLSLSGNTIDHKDINHKIEYFLVQMELILK